MFYIVWAVGMLYCFWLWGRVNKKLFGDLFSPLNIMLFGWVGPLWLRGFGLSEREHPWSMSLGLVIAWVTFSLILTSLMASFLLRGSLPAKEVAAFKGTIRLFQSRTFLNLVLAIFAVSFAAYLYSEFVTNPAGIPMLTHFRDPNIQLTGMNRWGKEVGRTIWSDIALPLQVLEPILYMGFRANSRRKGLRWFLIFAATLYPVMSILKLSRIDLLFSLISIAVVEYYFRVRSEVRPNRPFIPFLKFFRYALLAFAGIIILNSFLIIRIGEDFRESQMAQAIGLKIDAGPLTASCAEVYGDFALPLENFSNFYEGYSGQGYIGVGALRPLFTLLGQSKHIEEVSARLNMDRYLLLPINTTTFLMLIYAEMGTFGLILIPPIYGMFISVLYARFRRQPSFLNMFMYLNFLPCWMWLFAANGFGNLSFWLNAFFIGALFTIQGIVARNAAGAAYPTLSGAYVRSHPPRLGVPRSQA